MMSKPARRKPARRKREVEVNPIKMESVSLDSSSFYLGPMSKLQHIDHIPRKEGMKKERKKKRTSSIPQPKTHAVHPHHIPEGRPTTLHIRNLLQRAKEEEKDHNQ